MRIRAILPVAIAVATGLNGAVEAQEGYNDQPGINYEQCENCLTFPDEFMQVEPGALLDLAAMPAERRLDFLVGEWQLYYPADEPAAFEAFRWWLPGRVLEATQDWSLDPAHHDKIPWRARSYFRYYKDPGRWQLQWISSNTSSLFSGGLENGNVMAFYENEFFGGPGHLQLRYPAKYVFRNITKDSFVVEWYDSADEGKTYAHLTWRLYYRRRVNQFAD
jgi:hypothetical protein